MYNKKAHFEFVQNFRPKRINNLRGIGIECEIPVVDSAGEAVSLSLMQDMYHHLADKGFILERDESYDMITAAKRINAKSAAGFGYSVDTITVDAGFSTLEIALAPQRDLSSVHTALNELLDLLVPWFESQNSRMLGYGVQPVTHPARHLITPGGRYLFTEQFSAHRLIPKSQGADSDLLNISASNQCHLEVGQDEAVDAVNLINAFSGLSIALNANSPIWKGGLNQDYKANREMFWDYCFPGRPGRTGVPAQFESVEAYVEHLISFSPFLIKRGDQYLQIPHFDTFGSFLATPTPIIGKTLFGGERYITSELSDLHQHISFFWFNARLVPKYGTVESRMCCQQPPSETLCSTALTLGILENSEAAKDLMNRFPWPFWQQLREEAARHTFDAHIEGQSILPLLEEVLAIAEQGLQQRGLGEEKWLAPLFKRLDRRKSPADDAIEIFNSSGIEGLIDAFAFKAQPVEQEVNWKELMYSLP